MPAAKDLAAPTALADVWEERHVGIDALLLAVVFASDRVAVAVGGDREDGPAMLVRSESAGDAWTRIEIGVSHRLYDVGFVTPRRGHACGLGGTLLRTEDGGLSWRPMDVGSAGWLASVRFVTPDRGFVAGADEGGALLLGTSDGGKSWARVAIADDGPGADARSGALRKLRFRDGHHGIAVGAGGLVVETRDGGATWRTSRLPGARWLRDVAFGADGRAWVAAADGTVFQRSPDEGADEAAWVAQATGIAGKVNALLALDGEGILVATMAGGIHERLEIGGAWRLRHASDEGAVTDLERAPDGRVFAVGDGRRLFVNEGARGE